MLRAVGVESTLRDFEGILLRFRSRFLGKVWWDLGRRGCKVVLLRRRPCWGEGLMIVVEPSVLLEIYVARVEEYDRCYRESIGFSKGSKAKKLREKEERTYP